MTEQQLQEIEARLKDKKRQVWDQETLNWVDRDVFAKDIPLLIAALRKAWIERDVARDILESL